MKIGQLDNSHKLAAPAAVDARAAGAPPVGQDAKATAVEPSAKVQLSPAATLLAAQGDTGDFDAEKVARIAQAIRNGDFHVNAEAIADKLIDNTRELIGPRSH
jgi:negative regulator of flagellin synthesis FlgM